ncbi:hypothetical protein Bca52824_061596 [Brassica carinata]|uniref:BZIP domain-containing protein n=1 Tax=Brassica carinata TaxID=52824 RepID=A0A8X7QZM0_BRACI|nr:hypothetical protein Bca52824_061596 [Brassica carinata]
MGSKEEGKTTQSDKPAQVQAPPPPEQSNVHVYHHDWAAMQAYYGPRVAITPQYYNSNGHAPPYIWGSPSPMMAPYGTPYPPFCPPGGVYAHPALQMGSQPQGPASQATPVVATPLNLEAHPANSSGNTDQGSENDDSSNGSDGNTTGGEQSRKKRSREGSPNNDGKPSSQIVPLLRDENEKQAVTMGTPVMPTNEKEVKREKRKQSNRESARRSRLRKQAETEELSVKVDALVAENMTLRSKLGQLNDESEKLRLENQALLDQLKAQASGKTENLISGVDKNNNSVSGSSSSSKNAEQQLLNVSLRTDSVAAS